MLTRSIKAYFCSSGPCLTIAVHVGRTIFWRWCVRMRISSSLCTLRIGMDVQKALATLSLYLEVPVLVPFGPFGGIYGTISIYARLLSGDVGGGCSSDREEMQIETLPVSS